ncbi:MAG: hypothetical protein CVU39_27210 [Chloroflexi bacterium HGW-Chloroflexi-10]|nr:MAG: hypothetical protein CVU39_27210 [Chloroflexi bacterium HGW-Chloroflexi-10]
MEIPSRCSLSLWFVLMIITQLLQKSHTVINSSLLFTPISYFQIPDSFHHSLLSFPSLPTLVYNGPMHKKIILILICLCLIASPASTVGAQSTDSETLRAAIQHYFELRYQSMSDLTPLELSDLLADTSAAAEFWKGEQEKLVIQHAHARQFGLRYIRAEFQLDYQWIDLISRASRKQVVVELFEGHDVVFEITQPEVSRMRNQKHVLVWQKVGNQWKLVSDTYEDVIWSVLRIGKLSPDALLDKLDNLRVTLPKVGATAAIQHKIIYQRNAAVEYARNWATAAPPYNPIYTDFTTMGGDCTNFVSQAILAGGYDMVSQPNKRGLGAPGWYYTSIMDRSIAWTWVDGLYKLLIDYPVESPQAPYGSVIRRGDLLPGDIIQYDWGTDPIWNHTVMVTNMLHGIESDPYPLVAGHSPDVDNYPYQAVQYGDVRFIHIGSMYPVFTAGTSQPK